MEKTKKGKGLSKRAKIIIIAVSAVLAAAIAAGIIIGVIIANKKDGGAFDYLTEDLSEYIYMSAENYSGYKGYEVEIATDEITEDTVKTAIMQILAGERGGYSASGGGETAATVAAGDDILLYFQGYRVNEDGTKGEPIDGLGNFTVKEDKKRTYTVGGGSLDRLGLNLELALVGTELSKYTACTIADEGKIKDDDIIFLTYSSYALKDGKWTQRSGESVRYNLNDGGLDSAFGTGFEAMLKAQTIGKAVNDPAKVPYSTEEYSEIIYNNIKVEYVMRPTDDGQEPLRITTTVPCSYSDVKLQGTAVMFELYIDYAVKYIMPTLDEKFITETLELSAEELEGYEGEDTVSRFFSYTRELLEKREAAEIDAILIEAMWSHYYNIVEFKKLPEDEIRRLVNIQRRNIEEAYDTDDKGYESLNEFANAYIQQTTGSEIVWTDYLRALAESEVKEKLIFYYVARAESFLPMQESEFNALADKIIKEDTEYLLLANGIERDKYETEEAYNTAAEPYIKQVKETYDDKELLKYTVHLEFAEAKMSKAMSVVKYKNPAKDNAPAA